MSEEKNIKKARELIANNNIDSASKILWRLYESKTPKIKLDSILALLVTLDPVTENKKLLEIANQGLNLLSTSDNSGTKAYLMSEKISFLLTDLSFMVYRKGNLKLPASVFEWINFSTEREEKEFEAIEKKRLDIEKEIERLESDVLNYITISNDHYSKGNVYTKMGDCYSQKVSIAQFDAMVGGKIRSKIANMYFLRRWRLNKWIIYSKEGRKNIKSFWEQCVCYYNMAIVEFKAENKYIELAYAYYNLAVKYESAFKFAKSRKLLNKSHQLADKYNEIQLLSKIKLLRKILLDKNKNIKNYVEEYGLDLP